MVIDSKLMRILAVSILINAVIFLILAAAQLTAIPPLILAGLAFIWILGAGLLFYIDRLINEKLDNPSIKVSIRRKKKQNDNDDEESAEAEKARTV